MKDCSLNYLSAYVLLCHLSFWGSICRIWQCSGSREQMRRLMPYTKINKHSGQKTKTYEPSQSWNITGAISAHLLRAGHRLDFIVYPAMLLDDSLPTMTYYAPVAHPLGGCPPVLLQNSFL